MSLSSSAAAVLPAMISPADLTGTQSIEISLPLYTNVKVEDYEPITNRENVERYINDYFADIPLMVRIAKCESEFRHFTKGGEVLRGTKDRNDIGVMQINQRYHAKTAEKMGLNTYDLEDNVAYARYLYEKQGAKPWMASSACWAKFKESEIAKR